MEIRTGVCRQPDRCVPDPPTCSAGLSHFTLCDSADKPSSGTIALTLANTTIPDSEILKIQYITNVASLQIASHHNPYIRALRTALSVVCNIHAITDNSSHFNPYVFFLTNGAPPCRVSHTALQLRNVLFWAKIPIVPRFERGAHCIICELC